MKSIHPHTMSLPERAPVMFLNTVMLPQVMLPLYIFEPRYRSMVQHCLDEDRMFCIALIRPGVTDATGPETFFPIAGLGLLRACVGHPDGSSHLVLQGLARVHLRGFVQEQPFRIAELGALPIVPARGEEVEAMAAQVRRTCAKLLPGDTDDRHKLREQIAQITEPGVLCDVVAHTFLRDPYRQQEVMELLDVHARLETVLGSLREEWPQN